MKKEAGIHIDTLEETLAKRIIIVPNSQVSGYEGSLADQKTLRSRSALSKSAKRSDVPNKNTDKGFDSKKSKKPKSTKTLPEPPADPKTDLKSVKSSNKPKK